MGSFAVFHWIILFAILAILFSIFGRFFSARAWLLCKTCGYLGVPKSAVRGHIGIEIILWLFFIIPGVIYSLWRVSTRHNRCPQCGSLEMIPPDSPVAQKLLADK